MSRLRFWLVLFSIACVPVASAEETARPNIAVLDFSANNVSAGEASVVSEFVRAAMVRSGAYPVVDKTNMTRILAEQAFQQTGCTSEDCAVKLGKLLNVHKMVVGEYSVLEGVKFLTAKLVDVETGRIEGTGRVKGFTVVDADAAADRLVAQLTGVAPQGMAYGDTLAKPAAPPVPIYDRLRFSVGWGASTGVMEVATDYFGAPGGPYPGTARRAQERRIAGMMRVGMRVPLGGRWGAGLDVGAGIMPKAGDAGGAIDGVSASTGRPVNIIPESNTSVCGDLAVLGTYRLGRFVLFAGGAVSVAGYRITAQGTSTDASGGSASWRSEPPDANPVSAGVVGGVEILIGRDWSFEIGIREEVAGSEDARIANITVQNGDGTTGTGTATESAKRSGQPWLSGSLRINF